MSQVVFRRVEKAFYVGEKGEARFMMLVGAEYAGKVAKTAICWDFELSTGTLDGEIGGAIIYDGLMDLLQAYSHAEDAEVQPILDGLPGAFFPLFAVGTYAPGVPVDGGDAAKVAWAAEARNFVSDLAMEGMEEELAELRASGDVEGVDEEEVRAVQFLVQSGGDMLKLSQFPPEDLLQEVWRKSGDGWRVVEWSSHTLAAHIGLVHDSPEWMEMLDTLKSWAVKHGGNPFVVHAENDGDFLAFDDIADARLYGEIELFEKEG